MARTKKQSKIDGTDRKLDSKGCHFTDVTIENFRCFKEITIDSFDRINVIGGKNNVGKTTLLESIFLLLGATNISLIFKINAFRGIEAFEGEAFAIRETLWNHLYHNFNDQETISIKSTLESGKHLSLTFKQIAGKPTTLPRNETEKVTTSTVDVTAQVLQLKYSDPSGKTHTVDLRVDGQGIHIPQPKTEPEFQGIIFPARRHPSTAETVIRYGQRELTDDVRGLVKALQIIEPRLKRLSTVVGASGPMLYGDIGLGRMLPLVSLGDGFGSLLSTLLSISGASGGIVLIDEFENGIHYSVLTKIWSAIVEAARYYNTQVFATTHSWECVKSAHEAVKNTDQYDFRYHRLEKINDHIEAVTLDRETLETTIEAGWEIR